MMTEPQCPQCGAKTSDLRLIGKQRVHDQSPPSFSPVEAYQCRKCGLGFTFSPPPPRDPED
jgi:rubredoxin